MRWLSVGVSRSRNSIGWNVIGLVTYKYDGMGCCMIGILCECDVIECDDKPGVSRARNREECI